VSDETGEPRDLELLGLDQCDADELRMMQSAAALLAPMIERFLELDLSTVPVAGEVQYGGPPSP